VVLAELLGQLVRELGDRDDRRAGALGDVDDVAVVVLVAVREQDRVRVQVVGAHGRLRVAGEPRVDEHGRPVGLELEGGVTEPADVHREDLPFGST